MATLSLIRGRSPNLSARTPLKKLGSSTLKTAKSYSSEINSTLALYFFASPSFLTCKNLLLKTACAFVIILLFSIIKPVAVEL